MKDVSFRLQAKRSIDLFVFDKADISVVRMILDGMLDISVQSKTSAVKLM
ncbi:hypothetical protein ASAP_1636 [Asaia bogorensis]|uniref:Uncharacterized protein n=1 Tax=Asaia bogorensis TaxID=91915 RepID=A0A060QK59_9PROT|nr:hypothetical protein P792_00095 [Asaia sp. SF2.1]CDG39681.1 hypothetical protein ASAP_1636 [Asaia bogorensis]